MARRGREQLAFIFLGFTGVLAVGTAGYMLVERWGFVDSLYMTVITLTTVGYGEVRPLDPIGRIFTTGLIILGVGMVAYTATVIGQFVLDGTLARIVRRRRMQGHITSLKEHVIVCGMGRTGREAIAVLRSRGIPFVIIEQAEDVAEEIAAARLPVIQGSAHDNQVLAEAGIERARAVLACVGSDAENVFVALTARSMREDIPIACRCDLSESEPKLRRAGATSVVNPYAIAGRHLVGTVLQPGVMRFLETTSAPGGETDFEELVIDPGSSVVGHTLGELRIGQEYQVTILALRRASGEVVANPGASARFEAGDAILALGPLKQIGRLRILLEGGSGT